LKKSQTNIGKEIDEKRKYEIEIKSRIAKLIEEERERERKFREAKIKNNSVEPIVPKVNYAKFENFLELKGKMNWPVSSGKVVRKFGENKNEKLKTVTLNYGVDIKSKANAEVSAVAEGSVSVIDWIPGFGSIIIITHKGNYRTVYGHIDNIQVNEGDIVKAGNALGTVNKSLEGNIIHFEIWDERNYKNPQHWLVKK
jgi:septal ring factor EnvC (AmiA/AmiB activator)